MKNRNGIHLCSTVISGYSSQYGGGAGCQKAMQFLRMSNLSLGKFRESVIVHVNLR